MPPVPVSGSMRERITLQKQTGGTADGGGGTPVSWTDVSTFWARVEPLSVNQKMSYMALQMDVSHRVSIRYQEELAVLDSDKYRLLWASNNSQLMHIMGAMNPDEHRRFLIVTVKIGQAQST